jgi:hypothetical protein
MISIAESDPEGQARAVALRQDLDKLGLDGNITGFRYVRTGNRRQMG